MPPCAGQRIPQTWEHRILSSRLTLRSQARRADNYNCGIYDDTAGAGGSVDIGLLSRVAGADGTLDEIIDFNGTIGTVYHVRLSVVGTKVECCVNHTSCITATGQTELTTGNFVGMKTIPSTATTFDNLKAYTYSRGKMTE